MDYFSAVSSCANAKRKHETHIPGRMEQSVSLSVTYFPTDACGIDTNSGKKVNKHFNQFNGIDPAHVCGALTEDLPVHEDAVLADKSTTSLLVALDTALAGAFSRLAVPRRVLACILKSWHLRRQSEERIVPNVGEGGCVLC